MASKVHLTNVCSIDFDLDDTIHPITKSLYRVLKAHIKKGNDFQSSQFCRPSKVRLRNIMRIGTDKLEHHLRVLQILGLIIVHTGKKLGNRNEVNEYDIIDDMLLYNPNEKMKLGAGKDLFDEAVVLELFDKNEFPERPVKSKEELPQEALDAAKEICDRLRKDETPGLKIDEQKWAEALIKMSSPKSSITMLKEVALWAIANTFWKAHIINPVKFKNKFPTFYRQKAGDKNNYVVPVKQQRSAFSN